MVPGVGIAAGLVDLFNDNEVLTIDTVTCDAGRLQDTVMLVNDIGSVYHQTIHQSRFCILPFHNSTQVYRTYG